MAFTNDMDWEPRPPCKNGDPCHQSAPRGSNKGTQALKNAAERGRIPEQVFIEIFGHHKNVILNDTDMDSYKIDVI